MRTVEKKVKLDKTSVPQSHWSHGQGSAATCDLLDTWAVQIQNVYLDSDFLGAVLLSDDPLRMGGWTDGQTKEIAMTIVLTVYQEPSKCFTCVVPWMLMTPHRFMNRSTRGQGWGPFTSFSKPLPCSDSGFSWIPGSIACIPEERWSPSFAKKFANSPDHSWPGRC